MPGDGSSVRDALNHQSLQVSRDDPGPRSMIAVLDARPGVAGRLRETGGPGCGKSFTVCSVVELARAQKAKVVPPRPAAPPSGWPN